MKHRILPAFLFLFCLALQAQSNSKTYEKDVASINAIIHAYYDVISGPAEAAWEYERDAFIHMKNPLIIRPLPSGDVKTNDLNEEYIPLLSQPRTAFYESEIHRIVQKFGSMANVWSTFEMKTERNGKAFRRGVNNIQLYFAKNRWWIASWTTIYENENNPIPSEYLPK